MALDEYGLTIKRRRFADYYLENPNNQAEAYRKAGYSGGNETCRVEASKLLNNPNIKAYIEIRQKEIADRTTVTVEYIVEKAKKVLEMSLQEVPVMRYNYETKELEETGEYQFDSKGANGALKLLGDTIGAFKEKKVLEHTIPQNGALFDIMNQLKDTPSSEINNDE